MVKAGIILGFFSFIVSLCIPTHSFAAKTPRCTVANPGSTPILQTITSDKTSVTITWSEAADPVTHYLLAYGPSKDTLIYGSPNIGPKGSTTYTIDHLTLGQKYYFTIKAINQCEPGDFSNTLSIVVGAPPVQEKIYKMPNLSLYKTGVNATKSAAKKQTKPIITLASTSTCTTCRGLTLLVVQTIVVMIFLLLCRKISFLRPVFSLGIPLLFLSLFLFSQRNCLSGDFFCKYYVQLSLSIYLFLIMFHKFSYTHKKIESFELLLLQNF